jgi:hypothetical protein
MLKSIIIAVCVATASAFAPASTLVSRFILLNVLIIVQAKRKVLVFLNIMFVQRQPNMLCSLNDRDRLH